MEDLGYRSKELLIFGRSMGTGVAVKLIANHLEKKNQPAALIMFSAYTSIKDIIYEHSCGAVSGLVKDHYNSLEIIDKVHCPTLFIHGLEDTYIPIS
jgi:fermentation-respiration switch protein FrsA (DUF1100 family)